MFRALAGLALLPCSTSLIAQTELSSELTGNVEITGRDSIDPPPHQKKDRVGLFITGKSARLIYDAMRARAIANICEEGMQLKRAGSLECSKSSDGEYVCMVGILLTTGQSAPYGAC